MPQMSLASASTQNLNTKKATKNPRRIPKVKIPSRIKSPETPSTCGKLLKSGCAPMRLLPHLQTERCQNQAGGPALSQNGNARLKSQPYHPRELASFVTTTLMSNSSIIKEILCTLYIISCFVLLSNFPQTL